MKKILFLLAIFTFSSAIEIMAQSGMTDKQIIDYVVREQERGTPRSQIVTHLMQRGVKIDQIRSIQKKIQEGNEVMNAKDLGNSTYAQSRLRNKNAKSKKGKADFNKKVRNCEVFATDSDFLLAYLCFTLRRFQHRSCRLRLWDCRVGIQQLCFPHPDGTPGYLSEDSSQSRDPDLFWYRHS